MNSPGCWTPTAQHQVMPDDHSELVPLLPIPNRTVKQLRADDSAGSRVKVGHRQALTASNTPSRQLAGVLSLGIRKHCAPQPQHSIPHHTLPKHPLTALLLCRYTTFVLLVSLSKLHDRRIPESGHNWAHELPCYRCRKHPPEMGAV